MRVHRPLQSNAPEVCPFLLIGEARHLVCRQQHVQKLLAAIAILLQRCQGFTICLGVPAIKSNGQAGRQSAQQNPFAVHPPYVLVHGTAKIKHQERIRYHTLPRLGNPPACWRLKFEAVKEVSSDELCYFFRLRLGGSSCAMAANLSDLRFPQERFPISRKESAACKPRASPAPARPNAASARRSGWHCGPSGRDCTRQDQPENRW